MKTDKDNQPLLTIKITVHDPITDTDSIVEHDLWYWDGWAQDVLIFMSQGMIDQERGIGIPPSRIRGITWDPHDVEELEQYFKQLKKDRAII